MSHSNSALTDDYFSAKKTSVRHSRLVRCEYQLTSPKAGLRRRTTLVIHGQGKYIYFEAFNEIHDSSLDAIC